MSKIELYNIDCMEYLKTLEDNAYELAIVDPPYGIDAVKKIVNNRNSNSKKYKNYKSKTWKRGEWDEKPANLAYFLELKRVSKNQIIWGANHFIENIPKANSSNWAVWYKNGQCPNSDNADCELAYTSFKTAVKYYRFDWTGFGHINAKEKKIHPTQKPVKLYEWLLMNYAKEGDKILDTHLGSGSIAIACHNLNYDLVGCELDTDYYNAACKRLKQHQAQLTIF